ncbi:glycosyltransferase [Endozoicomonas sp. 4G]|uniref:glycosyltransferase family protein n=1 Tax=Endozoicomonas sp. 4G TaxID=2872754 RepID=UPI002078CE6C|nr:glycosyltransferase [Endozoicomonas sp. 4G]
MKKTKSRIAKKIAKRNARLQAAAVVNASFFPNNVMNTQIPQPAEKQLQGDNLNKEILILKQQLSEAQLKYRHVTQSHGELKQQLNEYQSLVQNTEQIQQQKELAEGQLRQKEDELYIANARMKASEISLSELKRNNLRNRIALGEKEQELSLLNEQLLQQKQNILKVKNHISYLLGNALVNSTKSWRNLVSLPGKLFGIRQDAKTRREFMEERALLNQQRLLPMLSKPDDMESLKRELQDLPAVSEASKLQSLKIACIMDTFTYESYAPEAVLLQLTPDNWKKELKSFQPEILFIESAWRGKHDLWGSKVGHTSQELVSIVEWCKNHNVITLFWNKEDPIHFETFLNTAKLFDYIFTTDIDCISHYKKALGHNQVYFLPFAAQPTINNPIEKYQRQDKFCFAGAYYVKYPERTKDLNNFVLSLPEYRDIDIYDRNFGKNDPNYMFPEEYQPYIVGTLPYEQIDKAYKGYNYAINLNSIKQSQSMFARRVFELLASNTITVSNFSHGLRLLFGDLVFTSDSGEEIVRRLRPLTGEPLKLKQFRLLALRKVLMEHTYQDRVNYIYSKLSNTAPLTLLPAITVLSYVKTPETFKRLLASFNRQSYAHKSLTIIYSGFEPARIPETEQITLLTPQQAEGMMLDHWINNQWLAVMVPEDFYGSDYLTDLALATRYCQHRVIGKKACYRWQDGLALTYPQAEYREVTGLTLRHSMVAASVLPSVTLRSWLTTLYTWKSNGSEFSIDSLNYCQNGAEHCEALPEFQLPEGINLGLSLRHLQAQAEAMAPATLDISQLKSIKPAELAERFKPGQASLCDAALASDKLQIVSQLPDGKHEYWYSNKDFTPAELNAVAGKVTLHLESTPGLNLQVVVLFLDAKKQRLNHTIFIANKNAEIVFPEGTAYLRPGLRVYAGGSAEVSNFYLEAKPTAVPEKQGCGDYLVLTNNYASYDDLYKNAFVHSRVKSYQQEGLNCDVFRFKPDTHISYHEFEDVDVVTGGKEVLAALLSGHQYKAILVHFLDANMWEVLQHHIADTKIIVWCHGSDVQSYRRRAFLYETDAEKEKAKTVGEKRDAFWLSLLTCMPNNLHMVFVSNYLKNCVEEDLLIQLPKDQYSIISNPINTKLFNYIPKPPEQRKKILSIRPYASKVYANDLAVKAILELSKEPFFNELEFRMVGDGPLFDETLEPLRRFSNVIIEKRFLNQAEIAALHKEYGIFLCPSRMDTQGVSRDEARSSGLIAVSSNVAAIPEFLSTKLGVLARAESFQELSEGIKSYFYDPEKFSSQSLKNNEIISCDLSFSKIISKECGLFL